MSEQEIALIGAAVLVALVAAKIGWMLHKSRQAADAGATREPAQTQSDAAADGDGAAASSAALEALTAIPAIGMAQAEALYAAGVHSVAELRSSLPSEERLHALADTLGLEDFVLARWAGCADLMQVDGLAPDTADALLRVGVRSSAALAQANPDRVQNKLAAAAARSTPPGPVPDRATVVALIAAAGRISQPD